MGEFSTLEEKLKRLPDVTGVYLLKDREGSVLYVGKALSLKKRVPTHFKATRVDASKAELLRESIIEVDYIATTTEMEALVLEDSLVKQYNPRYNIRLKDDKQYPFIFISTEEEYPRIFLVRRRIDKKGLYFGPYTSSKAVKEIIKFTGRTFGLANCKKVFKTKGKSCLEYQLGNCLAPCLGKASREEYHKNLKNAIDFLKGDIDSLLECLKKEMMEEAENLCYEKAARIRDRIIKLEQLLIKQKIYFPADRCNKDFIVLIKINDETLVERLRLRSGRLIGEDHFYLENTVEVELSEITHFFLKEKYLNNADTPQEIILQIEPSEKKILVEALSSGNEGDRVDIRLPLSEEEENLLELAMKNGQIRLEAKKRNIEGEELKKILFLSGAIRRIEGYDISHLQGEYAVGSMVTFIDGKAWKNGYRRFKLKKLHDGDDYGALREVIVRRIDRFLRGDAKFYPLPDLMLIDGGKGQLNIAIDVLNTYKLKVPVVSLAKEEELIYTPQKEEPINLPSNSKAQHLLQRVRDEAHRFGLRYHKTLKEHPKSSLESLPGIGKKRTVTILKQVGSLDRLKSLSIEDIHKIKGVPVKVLKDLYEILLSSQEGRR